MSKGVVIALILVGGAVAVFYFVDRSQKRALDSFDMAASRINK